MTTQKENNQEKTLNFELRPIIPEEIVSYVNEQYYSQIRVELATSDELITIPQGWHGAGKEGEVLVEVGDMLTKPIAGTKLSATELIRWSNEKGFQLLDSQDQKINENQAVEILEGEGYSWGDNKPMLRISRSNGVPIEIQFYGGATNHWIRSLSRIGNKDTSSLSEDEKKEYRLIVQQLFRPFISKGTKNERAQLGLPKTVDILRRVDDCAASLVTILGDQIIDDYMKISRENLVEVHDFSVATVQAVVLAITIAERRNVPLIMRIGAPAFGLGRDKGLNYIMNTLPAMLKYGLYGVGDMGKIMDEGESADAIPKLLSVRQGDASRELRLFLGGGLPVSKMLTNVFEEHEKPIGWDIAIRRAKRVDNGPKKWAVLMSGTNLTVRAARRDKSFFSPGTVLTEPDGHDCVVKKEGLWASVEPAPENRKKVSYIDATKGHVDLYQLLPEKKTS